MNGIEKAKNFIFNRFFCEKTGLIYDFLIDDGNAWHHLPSPHEIKKQIPNPCGWGTGMEDSVLNGGSVLDALAAECFISEDISAIKPFADKIFDGMVLCANAGNVKGFIARSVSPLDGKSFYCNSSRDQYTHWIYGAVRFYNSPLCDERQKKIIKQILTDIAEKCLNDVTAENDFNILRADGKIGLCQKMWGELSPHEYLRLPMFYAAAYHVTGDIKQKTLCDKYAAEALEKTKVFTPEKHRCYVTLQLQYSLRLLCDCYGSSSFFDECSAIMEALADYCENKAFTAYKELKANNLSFKYNRWNDVVPLNMGKYGDYEYLNPAQSELDENTSFYPLREIGEAASVAALCYSRPINRQLCTILESAADEIDYSKHYTYAPLLLACGHSLCKENIFKTNKEALQSL